MGGQRIVPDQNAYGARLDGLPPEIKLLVLLNLPDPSSLRALVRASPSYHKIYVRQRQHILSTALFNNLHLDGLHTALTLEEASRISHASDSHGSSDRLDFDPAAVRFRYSAQPSSKCLSWQWLQRIDFDTLVSVIRRHWIITTIASRYFEDKTSTNPVTGKLESLVCHSQPSRSESHRIHRALYHFQLYYLLFVSQKIFPEPPSQYGSRACLRVVDYQYAVSRFLPILESWEIEEIACIREHIMSHYSKIFQNCAPELLKNQIEAGGPAFSLGGTPLHSLL